MTDQFTPQDRERSQKTLTLLEQHVKLSDERHGEMKIGFKDHEKRIRKTESSLGKVSVVAGFVSAGITAGIVAVIKKVSG